MKKIAENSDYVMFTEYAADHNYIVFAKVCKGTGRFFLQEVARSWVRCKRVNKYFK